MVLYLFLHLITNDKQIISYFCFDSSFGGPSVLSAISEQMPEESIMYFSDQGYIPYDPCRVL